MSLTTINSMKLKGEDVEWSSGTDPLAPLGGVPTEEMDRKIKYVLLLTNL